MNNMNKLIALLVYTFFIATGIKAQTDVVAGVTQGKDYGVVYTLPKTELKVDIKVTKITYTPGEFCRYADRYLRLPDISGEPEQHWELNSVVVTSIGVPDSEKSFFVKMKDKTVAPLIELTEEGLLKSINVPYTKNKEVAKASAPTPKKKINPRDFLTQEILMANSTAKMAELTAGEIYNIRESRNALVRGQADNMPKDGEQLRLMLNSLDEQESALIELFSGIKEKEEKELTFTLTPDKEWDNDVLFRFSRKLGVLAADDLAGEPVLFTLKNMNVINFPEEDKRKGVAGIAYNVPGRAHVTVSYGKEKMFEGELPITQFGIIEYLAPTLFNKNSTTQVTFNPATGGLIKVDRGE